VYPSPCKISGEAATRLKLESMPQSFRDLWAGRKSERTVEYKWVWMQISPPPKRILDVGCVESKFALRMAEYGYEVVAIDMRPYGYRHKNMRVVQGDFFDFDDEKFDYTIAISTLEHFGFDHYGKQKYDYDWFKALEHMVYLTRDGGWILATMPYGVQIGGYNWIYTPTRANLDYIVETFGNARFWFYCKTSNGWKECSHNEAEIKIGLHGGFPTSIVCIKIRKEGFDGEET